METLIEILSDLNWPGVGIGAIAVYFLGAVWFSPRGFGKAWLAALGKTPKQLSSPAAPMIWQAVYTVLLAVFIATLHSLVGGGFCIAVGMLAALQFLGVWCGAQFQNQDRRLPMIVGGYEVAMTVVIACAVSYIHF